MVVDHRNSGCCPWHVWGLPIPNYLLGLLFILLPRYFGTIPSKNVRSLWAQVLQIPPYVYLASIFLVVRIDRAQSFLISETGFQMLGHLGSKNIIAANVTLLKNLLLLWGWYDFLFHYFPSIWVLRQLILLINLNSQILVLLTHTFKYYSFNNFIIIPIYACLLLGLVDGVLFSFLLFLFCWVILENFLALIKNWVFILSHLLQRSEIFLVQVQYILISLMHFNKILVIAWWFFQKLELWITFLSLA